jgi:glycosyltransferase involved in cell wall biosynthesis
MGSERLRILHLITGLSTGGAEIMLGRLVSAMDRERFENLVISMTNGGAVGESLTSGGVRVGHLGIRDGISSPAGLVRLSRIVQRFRPDAVQSWMYHANLLASLLMQAQPEVPLIWGLHHSNLAWSVNKPRTLLVVRLCAALSPWVPRAIVCCSEAVRTAHESIGYDSRKLLVVRNGYDTELFRPDERAAVSVRTELGIPQECPLVTLAARFHPQKDHRCFLDAAAVVHEAWPEVHYVLCGEGVVKENATLAKWIEDRKLAERVHLLGRIDHVQRVMAASTVVASSSVGEAMANVIGEAMACGAVCVVTDVGDSARVVGDAGFVVPANDPPALGRCLLFALGLDLEARRALGTAARRRIEDHFSLSRTVSAYEELYKRLAEAAAQSAVIRKAS